MVSSQLFQSHGVTELASKSLWGFILLILQLDHQRRPVGLQPVLP